ncbi:MAG: T9SS type A sorting domain-containing protein [Bacteroidales bacterium]|nr:T9SS type A sorting domain-containing protein [Bacteroidales bacterium]
MYRWDFFSLSGLPRGLYLLRVETAGGTAVRKVVVE